jgi:hypothetical protein
MYVSWRLDLSCPSDPHSTGGRFHEVKPSITVLDIPMWAQSRFLRYRVQLLGKCITVACTCGDWLPDIVDMVADEEYLMVARSCRCESENILDAPLQSHDQLCILGGPSVNTPRSWRGYAICCSSGYHNKYSTLMLSNRQAICTS